MIDPEILSLLEFFNLTLSAVNMNSQANSVSLSLSRQTGDRWIGRAPKNGSAEGPLLSALYDALDQFSIHWKHEAEDFLPFSLLEMSIPEVIPVRFSLHSLRVESIFGRPDASAIARLRDGDKVSDLVIFDEPSVPTAIVSVLSKLAKYDGKLLRYSHNADFVWLHVCINGTKLVGKASASPCFVRGIANAFVSALNQYSILHFPRVPERRDPMSDEVLETRV